MCRLHRRLIDVHAAAIVYVFAVPMRNFAADTVAVDIRKAAARFAVAEDRPLARVFNVLVGTDEHLIHFSAIDFRRLIPLLPRENHARVAAVFIIAMIVFNVRSRCRIAMPERSEMHVDVFNRKTVAPLHALSKESRHLRRRIHRIRKRQIFDDRTIGQIAHKSAVTHRNIVDIIPLPVENAAERVHRIFVFNRSAVCFSTIFNVVCKHVVTRITGDFRRLFASAVRNK